jgi:hypothetical protein
MKRACIWSVPAVLALGALLTGCTSAGYPGYYAGGNMASNGRFVYESTRHTPMSVDLRNQRTREIIWSYDIPAGQQLVIDFDEGTGSEREGPGPDTMRWGVMPMGTSYKSLNSSIQVPTAAERVLEPRIRANADIPEQASGGIGSR